MIKGDKEAKSNRIEDHTAEFLIAEYTELNQEFRRQRGEGLNRLNFFIAITSSILAGLVFLSQSGQTPNALLQLIAIGAILFLILIGWETYKVTLSRDISTDDNVRRIGRIRRFFTDRDPSLEKYLPWSSTDKPTPWITRNRSGIRRTAQSILSLLCALIILLVVNLLANRLELSISSGIVAFVIAFSFFRGYAIKRYKEASERALRTARFLQESEREGPQ